MQNDVVKTGEELKKAFIKLSEALSEVFSPIIKLVVKQAEEFNQHIIEVGEGMLKMNMVITDKEKAIFWYFLKSKLAIEEEFLFRCYYDQLVEKKLTAKKIHKLILKKRLLFPEK